jgi:hypothetical protein
VTGSGFSSTPGGNAVDLPATDASGALVWVPCAITAASAGALTCVPGAAPNSSAAPPAAGVAPPFAPGSAAGLPAGAVDDPYPSVAPLDPDALLRRGGLA